MYLTIDKQAKKIKILINFTEGSNENERNYMNSIEINT